MEHGAPSCAPSVVQLLQQSLAQDIWKYLPLYLTNPSLGIYLQVAIYPKKLRRGDTHTLGQEKQHMLVI